MTKSSVSKEKIKHLAHLARLDITEEEAGQYAEQITNIFHFIDLLEGADAAKEAEKNPAQALRLRQDAVFASLKTQDVLKGAPEAENNFFKAPRIL